MNKQIIQVGLHQTKKGLNGKGNNQPNETVTYNYNTYI